MSLTDANLMAIGSLLYFAVTDDKRAYVTAYQLKWGDGSRDFQPVINPDTGSESFPGIMSETQNVSFASFKPRVVEAMRIYPQAWVEAMVLRWQLMFCSGKYHNLPKS